MARVVRFRHHGGPDVLRIETIDVPPPATGEVQIRVKALGLNRAEALLRKGTYIERTTFPSGLGLEAAGIVEAVGDDVTSFVPGDIVSIVPPLSMVRWPAYAELANFPAELVVKHPPELGFEAAAALWMQFLTAYGALVDIADDDLGARACKGDASSPSYAGGAAGDEDSLVGKGHSVHAACSPLATRVELPSRKSPSTSTASGKAFFTRAARSALSFEAATSLGHSAI